MMLDKLIKDLLRWREYVGEDIPVTVYDRHMQEEFEPWTMDSVYRSDSEAETMGPEDYDPVVKLQIFIV